MKTQIVTLIDYNIITGATYGTVTIETDENASLDTHQAYQKMQQQDTIRKKINQYIKQK